MNDAPLPVTVQRLGPRVRLAPHPNALHEPPGSLIRREAARGDATDAQVYKAELEDTADGFGRVPGSGVLGLEHPTELSLGGGAFAEAGLPFAGSYPHVGRRRFHQSCPASLPPSSS